MEETRVDAPAGAVQPAAGGDRVLSGFPDPNASRTPPNADPHNSGFSTPERPILRP